MNGSIKCTLAVSLLAIGAGLAAAYANDPEVDCAYAVTQTDLNICSLRAFQAADADLNQLYAKAMANMKAIDEALAGTGLEGAAKTLRDAQRAWIPFRDKACETEGFLVRGGSMEPMIINGCMTTLTKQRIEDLKRLTEGFGN